MPLVIGAVEGIGCAHPIDIGIDGIGKLEDGFLVGDGHAVAANIEPFEFPEGGTELIFGDANGDVDGVQPEFSEGGIMDERTLAVRNRITDDGEDACVPVDAIEGVQVANFGPGELPWRHFSFATEAGVGEGGPRLAAEDATDCPEFSHAEPNGGNAGGGDQFEQAYVVGGRVGHGDDFDDVRVALAHASMNIEELDRRFFEVVVADDAFGFSIATDGAGDVFFEIDVFSAADDGFAENGEALFFGAKPAAAINFSSAGDNHGGGSVFEETADIGLVAHEVDTKFNQFRAFGGECLVLFDHGRVSGSSEADADHGCDGPGVA